MRHLRIDGWSSLLLRKGELRILFAGPVRLRAITPFLPSTIRLTRASANLSSILTTTPRCFLLATGGTGPRFSGGEIFSNVKAGIVHPLFVELKTLLESSSNPEPTVFVTNRSVRSNADNLIEAWIMPNCGALQISALPRSSVLIRSEPSFGLTV